MITLYSQYFNPNISRRLGRRINREKATRYNDSRLESILKSMNLNYEIKKCKYPRIPYEETNMFLIDGNIKKGTLIKIIENRL
ncbi:signal recognition particle [Acidiplasma aeolicum]|uniref:Signal recognition particle n=1 Tax=Acidiplasma aeolicum TaxID=507754 RepID=A0A0P9F359_9ARCH|nr:signal recognition particle subunit SRP19/SEC65 family protein [Acidiplasma aeolicum]KPV45896.1 signal recognition particle [Acidiplasma aeolicum]KQB33791.1 signal recognition particle [Acidiplasma aeolicum]